MMQFDEEADLKIMSPAQFKRNPHCRRVSPIDPTPLVDPYQQKQHQQILLTPINRQKLLEMKIATPARIGLGRCGTRYLTQPRLKFLADHAAARDAVLTEVTPKFIQQLGLITAQTTCQNKQDYLKNPPKGRQFTATALQQLTSQLPQYATIQLIIGDGLSSAAITSNLGQLLPLLQHTFKKAGTPIDRDHIPFIKYARVAAMDAIGATTKADVVCMLIGERPGLVSANSLSAYIAYRPEVGMPEARRTVISNIHAGGTTVQKAAQQINAACQAMLRYHLSGVALKQKLASSTKNSQLKSHYQMRLD
jgi:ethanolamine ammonia-lyase small subunit